jgi:hypothetical protein
MSKFPNSSAETRSREQRLAKAAGAPLCTSHFGADKVIKEIFNNNLSANYLLTAGSVAFRDKSLP